MEIFIDESGSFTVPPTAKTSICCVAALAITEQDRDALLLGFERIVAGWKLGTAEPKGWKLSERQIDRVLTHLSNFEVVLKIAAIDMGLHTTADVDAHRKCQANLVGTSADGPQFKESLRKDLRELGSSIEATPNDRYVQSAVLTQAVWYLLRTAKTRYAQTQPKALGRFAWRIDAKDKTITEYERMWMRVVKPMLQTISMRDGGLISVDEFDYSAMKEFQNPTRERVPEHLAVPMQSHEGPFHSGDLKKLLKDLTFEDSRTSRGLQLVDIAASAFRRALTGKLQPRGWRRLGGLLVRDFNGVGVHYLSLRPKSRPVSVPYSAVAIEIERDARHWEVAAP